jgi:hypothetical protein
MTACEYRMLQPADLIIFLLPLSACRSSWSLRLKFHSFAASEAPKYPLPAETFSHILQGRLFNDGARRLHAPHVKTSMPMFHFRAGSSCMVFAWMSQ